MYKLKGFSLCLKSLVVTPFKCVCMVLITLSVMACTSMEGYRDANTNPDDRLDDLLILFQYQQSIGNQCLEIRRPASVTNDCQRLIVEIERIYADFPYHERSMMALAAIYYQIQRRDRAQFLLDQLLDVPGSRPEAAILRARIALEEGNAQLAAQVLLRQVLLAPESGELRSALASVYYAEGDIQRARNVLNSSSVTHEHPWILTYHNGLLAEAEKDWLGACQLYLQSLSLRPAYAPALSRIIALAEHITCNEGAAVAAPLSLQVPQPPTTTAAQLTGVTLERTDEHKVIVDLNTHGNISDVLLIQTLHPPMVSLQLPATSNQLGHSNETFGDRLLASMTISADDAALNVHFLMNANANARLLNEAGRLRLYLEEGSGE